MMARSTGRKKTKKRKCGGRIKLTVRDQICLTVVLLVALGWFMSAVSCSVTRTPGEVIRVSGENREIVFPTAGLEIPKIDDHQFVITEDMGRYTYLYDTMYRQAAWVAYVLTRSDVESPGVDRSRGFTASRTVREQGWSYSVSGDYTNSGYDRGHLLPSADRNLTVEENKATFLMPNVSPQKPGLNRGIWKSLEEEVRRMAVRMDTLYVVTGGEIKPGLETIGKNRVGIPERYFKVILAKNGGKYMSIGFVIPNEDVFDGTFWDYSVSVRDVEKLSGYDFFHNLPDLLEEEAESSFDLRMWR